MLSEEKCISLTTQLRYSIYEKPRLKLFWAQKLRIADGVLCVVIENY